MLAKAAAADSCSTAGPDGDSHACAPEETAVVPGMNRRQHDHYLVAAGCSASGPSDSPVIESAPETSEAGTCSVMAEEVILPC